VNKRAFILTLHDALQSAMFEDILKTLGNLVATQGKAVASITIKSPHHSSKVPFV
jgi:hypothetical protein